jgi:2-iminobutanoate/2-iminopropanoate deaminase
MLRFTRSPETAAAELPFSDVVRVGDVLYLSGAMGSLPGTKQLVASGMGEQTRQMFRNISRTLDENGLTLDDVFKCQVFLTDMAEWPAFNRIYLEHFKPDRLPVGSALGGSGLALGARVEMEVVAFAGAK